MEANLDTLLCDMDGTLFFTYKANFLAYQAACADYGLRLTERDFQIAWGSDAKEFLPLIFRDASDTLLSKVRHSKAQSFKKFLHETEVNTPLLRLLQVLKGSVKLGLVTNAKSRNVNDLLEFFRLQNLFDTVVTGDDVTRPKPEPDAYTLAINRLNSDPVRTIAIEDSLPGKASAISAGIECLMIGTHDD